MKKKLVWQRPHPKNESQTAAGVNGGEYRVAPYYEKGGPGYYAMEYQPPESGSSDRQDLGRATSVPAAKELCERHYATITTKRVEG
jgi:hypothetical protein